MPSLPSFEPFLPPRVHARAGKSVSVQQAVEAIPDGARVYVATICAVPTTLVEAIAAARDRWQRLEFIADYLIEPLAVFEHPGEPFHHTSLQPSGAVSAMRDAGALRTVPASYSQFAGLQAPEGPLPVDVALVQVSPPGPDGTFSLGVGGGAAIEVVRTSPFVIAEVNPQMPYTFGASELARDEIDLLVDVDHPLIELVVPPANETALAIGAHAAALIPDEAVLQFGIGSIPESILAALSSRRDLGLHGGMISDAIVDLVEGGAITGAAKNTDPGLMIAAAVAGTRKVFDWVHRNEAIRVVPSSYSHGLAVLSQVENFVAINSTLEIAADGSVNAEMAGSRIVSGPGGQPDFAYAAWTQPSGTSILAMPSTAARGTVSRIVPQLAAGVAPTIGRYLVDKVVTEFGIADLCGVPLEGRAAVLAEICHPDFRDALS